MTSLIACLSTGKGTWAQVTSLIKSQPWDTIILVTNLFGKENYKPDPVYIDKTTLVVIDDQVPIQHLVTHLSESLKGKIQDFEVALNISSGTGKEHMALITALIKSGYGFRLVHTTQEGTFEEI